MTEQDAPTEFECSWKENVFRDTRGSVTGPSVHAVQLDALAP